LAYFHIQNQHGQNQPAVKGIELRRPAFTLINNERPTGIKAYDRIIDIVLEGANDTERWIETKSLQGPFKQIWFTNTLKAKNNKDEGDSRTHRGYFRQFFHDMRLNKDFINDGNSGKILNNHLGNAEYSWYFHDFSKKRGIPPTAKDITQARKWLCKVPEVDNRTDYYKSNLAGTQGEVRARCALNAVNSIQKRDTQSYIKDLLKPYASQMGIEDFVEIIEKLDL
jgi:hypothetical protein